MTNGGPALFFPKLPNGETIFYRFQRRSAAAGGIRRREFQGNMSNTLDKHGILAKIEYTYK